MTAAVAQLGERNIDAVVDYLSSLPCSVVPAQPSCAGAAPRLR
jgi:hypothetical protein